MRAAVWACCVIVTFVGVTAGVLFPTVLYSKDTTSTRGAGFCAVSKAKWPLWYALTQGILFALTLAQATLLRWSPAAGATCSLEGHAGFLWSIRFVRTLHDPPSLAAFVATAAFALVAGEAIDALAVRGVHWLHRAHVVRNLALYLVTLTLDAGLSHATSCAEQQPWVSGMPIHEQVGVLVDKWLSFHRPEFFLVRVSHAFTYLDLLLLLSQRTGRQFAKWRIFVLVVPDIVADIAHYASSPSAAAERLAFDGAGTDLCAGMDRRLVRTIVSYPLNWIFLTTPLGHLDASPLTQSATK